VTVLLSYALTALACVASLLVGGIAALVMGIVLAGPHADRLPHDLHGNHLCQKGGSNPAFGASVIPIIRRAAVRAGYIIGSRAPNPYRTKGGVMSEEKKARIRAFIDRVLTAGEIDATGDYFHGDVVEEVPFPGQGPGLQGLTEMLTRLRRAFPDMAWRVEEQMAEDNRVLTRFRWSGTHRGEFLGIPATHHVVQVWSMVIDRLAGSRQSLP
jgi:predicted ester cyclase